MDKKDDRKTNSSQFSDGVFQNNRSIKAFKEKRKQMDGMSTLNFKICFNTLKCDGVLQLFNYKRFLTCLFCENF